MHISVPSGSSQTPVTSVVLEVELWSVVVEEWSMTSTFIFCKNVYLCSKLVVAKLLNLVYKEPVLFRFRLSEHHEEEHRCCHQPELHQEVYGTFQHLLQLLYVFLLLIPTISTSSDTWKYTTFYSTSSNCTHVL